MSNYHIFIPFLPSNYEYFDTKDNEHFYVKKIIDGSLELNLYKNSAEFNRVNKSDYLEDLGSIAGVLRESTSVTDLVITIEYDKLPDFNYVYISEFNRYYFVNDVEIENNKLYTLYLNIDILMSYNTQIRQLKGFVDRNEFTFNSRIVDDKMPFEQGVNVTYEEVPNNVFKTDVDGSTYCFIINGYKLNCVESDRIEEV